MKAHHFFVTLTSIVLIACSPPQPPASPTSTEDSQTSVAVVNESERLEMFFERTYQEDLKASPLTQSYRGLTWDYDKWDDISDARQSAYIEIQKARLIEANGFAQSTLSDTQKLSLELFKTAINRRLANDEFRQHSYIMNQLSAYHTMVPSFLINIHKVSNISDAEA